MFRNEAFGRGLQNLASAFMPDPLREAQLQASVSAARSAAAKAQLDEQTYDARQRIAAAVMGNDAAAALAYGAGAGNDYTRDLAALVGGRMSLPGSGMSEDDISQYVVGSGVQRAGDTFLGQRRDNASAERRQGMSSGATIRAAQIRAEASERIAAQQIAEQQAAREAALIEVLDPQGATIRVPQSEARGMRAPTSLTNAQGGLLTQQVAPALLAGQEVSPVLADIVGASAAPRGRGDGAAARSVGIEKLRLQIDTALEPFLENADPQLYASAVAEVERLIGEGAAPGQAIAAVVSRIQPTVEPGYLWDGEGPYALSDIAAAVNPPATTGAAAQNVTAEQEAILQDARAAIAAGADEAQVAERLRQMGLDPGML